jgi:hypothetical protein
MLQLLCARGRHALKRNGGYYCLPSVVIQLLHSLLDTTTHPNCGFSADVVLHVDPVKHKAGPASGRGPTQAAYKTTAYVTQLVACTYLPTPGANLTRPPPPLRAA